ncbi:MAG: LacI family DNA-binding transcriptional regulator [Chloroflexota bacterium]
MDRRRPTSSDVARAAGVSRTTVSFVLNDRADARISSATRRRVLDAAEELGYRANVPARQLAAGTSQTIGLVLRQSPEHVANDALLPDTLRGLAWAARGGDFRVLVEPLPPGTRSYVDLVRSRQVDGIVVSGPRSDDTALIGRSDGMPLVLQGTIDGSAVPSVDIDNRTAARDAVDHLIDLGHRRIGCITNASLEYTAARDRAAGYRDALADAGLMSEPGLLVEGDHDPQSGHDAMQALLAEPDPPTGVFVGSDVVAFGVFGALREAGLRVPHDVSVVGFDDIPLAGYTDPPLTTIRVPAYELGAAAGRVLLDLVAGRSVKAMTRLPAPLILRGSTAPPATTGVTPADYAVQAR